MRHCTILIVIALAFLISGTRTSATGSKGIDFYKGSYTEALKKAGQENKFVFVYVYAKWCGVCKKLTRSSFKDAEVGAYYNANYINVAVNGESEEGAEVLRSYGINSYPTVLIVDKHGQKMTKATGFMQPRILINFGRRIVP